MKQLITIKTHSFIDIITNSSSELYVCDKNSSIEAIKELLDKLCFRYRTSYEYVFAPLYIIDESNIDSFIKEYIIGWGVQLPGYDMEVSNYWTTYHMLEDKYPLKYPYNENEEYNKNQYDLRRKEDNEIEQRDIESIKNDPIKMQQLMGTICIFSVDDNSIPYEMMEDMEGLFNANRYHLG